tara:strand:- start:126 stop:431 length:306 start_codon:yes stop_codon:yes gene_type:complete
MVVLPAVTLVIFAVLAPPVLAKDIESDFPTGILSVKLGTLKVEDPSPVPYVVPITANKAEYVLLDTAAPSQFRYPVGALAVGHGIILPVSTPTRPVIFAPL